MNEELKIKETPTCPHCGQKMSKCETPTYNFGDVSSGWNDPFLYICFNDECKFFVEDSGFFKRCVKGSDLQG